MIRAVGNTVAADTRYRSPVQPKSGVNLRLRDRSCEARSSAKGRLPSDAELCPRWPLWSHSRHSQSSASGLPINPLTQFPTRLEMGDVLLRH